LNKFVQQNTRGEERRLFKSGKIKEIVLLGILGVALIFGAWKIFYSEKNTTALKQASQTDSEEKISRLLEEIDGVGDASVIICQTENGVEGAVVVCEGANDFFVVMKVREAVAAALGTEEKAVKIYLKKE
jgi:type III secretory pathway lipoprotein EscJ